MFTDRLRGIIRGLPLSGPSATEGSQDPVESRSSPLSESQEMEDSYSRPSKGLEQFFTSIKGEAGLSILDLAGVTQSNVNFITSLGHRLYSEDFLRSLRESFPGLNDQSNPALVDRFLNQNLVYEKESLDGVLIWDSLEHMSTPLLVATLGRLTKIVKPRGYLLAFFHAQDKVSEIPYYSFRIQDPKTLLIGRHGKRQLAQTFNNRNLEKLFDQFESLKFFLTRERLREVIIRR
ncbi:MAG: hypothetical protein WD696_08430 [Bryobacteraceae bacterium]